MAVQKNASQDLTRITLQVLWIGILILATFWIMRPFLPSVIWAAMIVIATWQIMRKIEAWLWGKRGLAVTVMTVIILLLFIIPVSFATLAIIDNTDRIAGWIRGLESVTLPAPPQWLEGVPLVGSKLVLSWQKAAAESELLSARLAPYGGQILRWFLSQAGSIGIITLQFLLTVIIAALFYSGGEVVSRGVVHLARRLGGDNGEDVAVLAAKTIKSVAIGVVGTALIQSILGGIGLAVAGIPAAVLLTAIIFIFGVAQLQPWIVMLPAVFWLYNNDNITWGTILLVWTIFVSLIDNILRPILIKKGADLPLVLIFAGVIGGLITFGIIGLFVGPVVLAVTYKLLTAWVAGPEAIREEAEKPVPP